MNHYTFKGLVKHFENSAAESRDKRLWQHLLSSCLSRHQTCAEFHLCDSVRNRRKWKTKIKTHLTASLQNDVMLTPLFKIAFLHTGCIVQSAYIWMYLFWTYVHLYFNELHTYVLAHVCLTLSAVISSSASAVVSSSSVFACCSWLSRARRAACRLLIWDSRSCKERVNSDTCRLISNFSSSCSRPIYKETGLGWRLCAYDRAYQTCSRLYLHIIFCIFFSTCPEDQMAGILGHRGDSEIGRNLKTG